MDASARTPARRPPLPRPVVEFFRLPGGRPGLVLAALLAASLFEGFGLSAALPLLAVAAEGEAGGSPAARLVGEAFALVGLSPTFDLLVLAVIGAFALRTGFMVAVQRLIAAISAGVASRLRTDLARALLEARLLHFVRSPAGRYAQAMGQEAQRCGEAYGLAAGFVVLGVQSAVYLGVALLVSPLLALLALVLGGGASLLLSGLVRRTRRAGRKRVRASAEMAALLTDTLANIRPIRAMAREEGFLAFLASRIRAVERAVRRQTANRESLAYLHEGLLVLFLAGGFWFAHRLGGVPVAEMVVSGVVLARTATTLGKLQKTYQRVVEVEASIDQMRALIAEARAAREDGGGGLPPPPLVRGIRFSAVSFAYGERPVLRDLDLALPAGRVIVLTGPSGAGKSTLLDLLLGFLEPDSGTIAVDGVPLSALDRGAWRRQVGYVPQDPVLLHASVRDNLTLGDPAVDEAALREALDLACARDVVESLPQGLETPVGERGTALSGGQRQRLALARALAGRPRLLLLDEATSALDLATEREVCRKVAGLRGRCTVLAVTHRPAWLEVADLVVELEGGGARLLRPAAE